jgi:MraZ protein
MSLFLSTFENKIDAKGRVSLPSCFRDVLLENSKLSIVLYESSINQCIEGCSILRIEEISKKIDNLDPFSSEKDAFASVILGGSVKLDFDKDGRILLPKHLATFAKVTDNATFIGKGQIFEIWNKDLLEQHLKRAREEIKKNREVFKNDAS